jgi:hypothetical protein
LLELSFTSVSMKCNSEAREDGVPSEICGSILF